MPTEPQKQKILRNLGMLAVAIMGISGHIFGPRLQAWYKTVPPKEAYAVGDGILGGFMVIAFVVVMIVVNWNSDA